MDNVAREKIKLLTEHLGIEPGNVEQMEFDDCMFCTGETGDYLIMTDDEANERAYERIRESLYTFNPDFIFEHAKIPLPSEAKEMIADFCLKKCEGANDTIAALVSIPKFVKSAIDRDPDGRGSFLNSYDGKEHELGDFYVFCLDQSWEPKAKASQAPAGSHTCDPINMNIFGGKPKMVCKHCGKDM